MSCCTQHFSERPPCNPFDRDLAPGEMRTRTLLLTSCLLLSAYLETKRGVASTYRNGRLIRTKRMCSLASWKGQVSIECIFSYGIAPLC